MNKELLSFTCIITLTLLIVSFGYSSTAQIVVFTDPNFKAAVVGNPEINKNGDSEIQLSEAVAYKKILNVSAKNISNLQGIEAFTEITGLYCNNNTLTAIDISSNTKLKVLRCNNNQLTAIDVHNNTALIDLRCYVNQLSSLNLSANTQLSILWCFENDLTELNTSNATKLTELRCAFNPLTALDLSANHELSYLDARQGRLTWLNVKNGNNTNITFFNATFNSSLLCIQVDDPAYSSANWTEVDSRVTFNTDCETVNTEVVYIPDPNFKQVLLDSWANQNGDSEIQVAEAASYTDHIYAPNKNIHDVTGLEAFTSLSALSIYENPITTLDVSKNTNLYSLKCSDTQITTLDVSANKRLNTLYAFNSPLENLYIGDNDNLRVLWCFNNKLTSLDLSAANKIEEIQCGHNQLTSLTLGTQTGLWRLTCFYNQLPALDISGAPGLTFLECNFNKLTSIDTHTNVNLRTILCHDNLLETLDVSQCTFLRSLTCTKNKLVTLDLSHSADLASLSCNTNNLAFINLRNGNNTRISTFTAIENPHLTCVQVDDPAYAEANWRDNVDSHTMFERSCDGSDADVVAIPDPVFKARLVNDGTINTNGDSEIQIAEARAVTGSLDVSGLEINFLTGIEEFTSLTSINCSHNNLGRLYVDKITPLKTLDCSFNSIGELTINSMLENLFASHNHINFGSVNQSNNSVLKVLDLNTNGTSFFRITNPALGTSITYLDLSNNSFYYSPPDLSLCTGLKELYLTNSNINEPLNASACVNLEVLDCRTNRFAEINVQNGNNTRIRIFNATDNPYLKCVQVDDVEYAKAHFQIPQQARFSISCSAWGDIVYIPDPNFRTAMTRLVDGNTGDVRDGKIQRREAEQLRGANVSGWNIKDLTGIEAFTDLKWFDCANNQITTFPQESLNRMWTLNVSNNRLTALDFSSGSIFLQALDCSSNNLSSLNVKNGYNSRFLTELIATDNPELFCIEVDDPAYSEANWRDTVDPQVTFSTECGPAVSSAATLASSARAESVIAYPNPTKGNLTINTLQPVSEVMVFDIISGELKSKQHGNEIDISSLKNGVYRMSIKQGGTTSTIRIVKE